MNYKNYKNALSDCNFFELQAENPITDFDCDDNDLNDFFNHDALLFQSEKLGQTYYYRLNEMQQVVCAFLLSADSLKTVLLSGSRIKRVRELIPREKALQSYPAFLIGRLCVSVEFAGQGVGSQLIKNIKFYCNSKFPTLVRFLIVDAYNNDAVLTYYQKNDFSFVFSTEQQEKEKENIKKALKDNEILRTRQMFYDMKRWNNENEMSNG
jgi:predicted GNAT family N-acyltransferase